MPKGIYPRGGYKPRKSDPPALVDYVRREYGAGMTQIELANAIGRSLKFIQGVFRRNGIQARIAAKRNQWGANNSSWKGDDASYQALHLRVEAVRGAPPECSRCGTSDPTLTYDWANLTGNYADTNDYERMCRSCHRRYDNARREGVMPVAAFA